MYKFIFVLVMILFACDNTSNNDKFTFNSFISEVEIGYEQMIDAKYELNKKDAVHLAKLYNSIYYYGLKSESLCGKFIFKFENDYIKRISELLDCSVSFGMGMFCEDFDLFIGGALRFEPNSYYEIDGEYFRYIKENG